MCISEQRQIACISVPDKEWLCLQVFVKNNIVFRDMILSVQLFVCLTKSQFCDLSMKAAEVCDGTEL
jgi:hypothetical protein